MNRHLLELYHVRNCIGKIDDLPLVTDYEKQLVNSLVDISRKHERHIIETYAIEFDDPFYVIYKGVKMRVEYVRQSGKLDISVK